MLSTYIQFQCNIPHPLDSKHKNRNEDLNRSSSNPDLRKNEMSRIVDRTASMKIDLPSNCIGDDGFSKLLHEEIVLRWVIATNELSMTNSWVLFDLVIKSMIEHLDYTGALNAPRKSRFPNQFVEDIQVIIDIICFVSILH